MKKNALERRPKSKVFCIGLGKTGTTSMSVILKELGYRHTSGFVESGLIWTELGQIDRLWGDIDKYDSFDDFPFPYIYKELYERYPDAKFILTMRNNPEEWLSSLKKHNLRNGPTTGHLLAYGCYSPEGHESRLLSLYESHISEVSSYFATKRNFLKINLGIQDARVRLADFLEVELKDLTIPVANRADEKEPKFIIDQLMNKGHIGAAINYASSHKDKDVLRRYIIIKNERREKGISFKNRLPKDLRRFAAYIRRKIFSYE